MLGPDGGLLMNNVHGCTVHAGDLLVQLGHALQLAKADDIFDALKRLAGGERVHPLDDGIGWRAAIGRRCRRADTSDAQRRPAA